MKGAQLFSWTVFGSEVINVLFGLRWMIIFCIVLILTDFWWGWAENNLHREESATEEERKKYRFRFSTAGRRTLNKFVDYTTYLLIGCVAGLAITEPLGICNHNTSAALGLGFGCIFELSSIIGHIAAVKGITVKVNFKSILVAIAKRKSEALGEILDEGIETIETEKKDNDVSS